MTIEKLKELAKKNPSYFPRFELYGDAASAIDEMLDHIEIVQDYLRLTIECDEADEVSAECVAKERRAMDTLAMLWSECYDLEEEVKA